MNDPTLYTKVNDLQYRDAKVALERFSDVIQWRNDGTDTALDIGCGSGDVTSNILGAIMPKPFKCLKGIDKSHEMVQHATTYYESSNLSFEQWDVTDKVNQKLAEQFDHIFSFYALQWVPDQKSAFQNIYDLLKPCGDILITLPSSTGLYSIYKSQILNPKFAEVTKDVETYISPYYGKVNADLILKKLLKDIGFVNVFIQTEDLQYTFHGIEYFKNFLKAVYPPTVRLTGDLQNEMLQEFYITLAAKTSTSDEKRFILPYRVMLIYGQKS